MANVEYKISFLEDTGGDNYGEVETVKYQSSYEDVKNFYLENRDNENTRTDSYGNKYSSYYKIYDPDGNEITSDFKKEIENEERDISTKEATNETSQKIEENEKSIQSKADIDEEISQQKTKNIDEDNTHEQAVKNPAEAEKPDFAIRITPDENFNPQYKKFFEEKGIFNKIHNGDGATSILQMINELDQRIKEESFAKNEFPKDSLNFEIQTPSGNQLNFTAPMGRDLFKDGDLEKLINVSTEKIENNTLSEKDKRDWKKIFEKDSNKQYKLKVDTKAIGNTIDGGIDGLARAGRGLGDENIDAFLVAFTNSYGFNRNFQIPTREKDDSNQEKNKNNEKTKENKEEKDIQKTKNNEPVKEKQNKNKSKNPITQKELDDISKRTSEAVSKITKTKDKEKGISKPTSLGMS